MEIAAEKIRLGQVLQALLAGRVIQRHELVSDGELQAVLDGKKSDLDLDRILDLSSQDLR